MSKNIYIENHQEIKAICSGKNDEGRKYDVLVAMDIFDKKRGLKRDEAARAAYKEFCGLPLSRDDDRLLHPEKYAE